MQFLKDCICSVRETRRHGQDCKNVVNSLSKDKIRWHINHTGTLVRLQWRDPILLKYKNLNQGAAKTIKSAVPWSCSRNSLKTKHSSELAGFFICCLYKSPGEHWTTFVRASVCISSLMPGHRKQTWIKHVKVANSYIKSATKTTKGCLLI